MSGHESDDARVSLAAVKGTKKALIGNRHFSSAPSFAD